MEDSGIVDEMEPARRGPAVPQYVRTGWEAVVFLVEEIGSAERPCGCIDKAVTGYRATRRFSR